MIQPAMLVGPWCGITRRRRLGALLPELKLGPFIIKFVNRDFYRFRLAPIQGIKPRGKHKR